MKSKTLKYPTLTADTKEIVVPVDSKDAKSKRTGDATLHKFAPTGVSRAKIVELAEKDLPEEEIAKILGCHRSNVNYHLRPWRERLAGVKAYRKHSTVILEAIEGNFALSLAEADPKESSQRDQATILGIIRDKLNIERGKGQHGDITINLQTIITQQQASQREIEDMERKVLSGDD